jgi:hypothetical protein
VKAIDFLKWLRDDTPYGPHSREGKLIGCPSNSELRRWLRDGNVLVNGKRLAPDTSVVWPIWQLIFFPETKSQITLVDEGEEGTQLWQRHRSTI